VIVLKRIINKRDLEIFSFKNNQECVDVTSSEDFVVVQLFFMLWKHVDSNCAFLLQTISRVPTLTIFVGFFAQAPNENGEESDSDDDSMDEDGQGFPSSSGQQDLSMELDPPAAQGSKASQQQERPSTLTQEEMADGWQEAPARRKRRGGKRT